MRASASILPLILLAATACARSEQANLGPADENQAQEVETVRPERDDEEVALGAWRETLQEDQTALEFGPSGAPALFSLRCDARRGVHLQRHGLTTAGDLPVMLVSVGSETRRLAVTGTGGTPPMLRATLAASDQFLGVLSNAGTPIAIRIGDSPPLILPPGPAIGAYIQRCATGESGGRAASAPALEGNVSAEAPANAAAPAAE